MPSQRSIRGKFDWKVYWKKNKKTLLVGGAIILLLLFLGLRSVFLPSGEVKEELSPTPTEEITPSPTEEPTPTKKPTRTPTPKPTETPTPQPTEAPAPTSTPKPTEEQTITSNAGLDGFRSSNGGGNASLDVRAGRNVNLTTRGFVSFDLSSLPSGIAIEKATLKLYQTGKTGNPYGVGGSLLVDHIDYGDSLGDDDFDRGPLASNIGTISGNDTVEWKSLEVTDRVKDDLANGRGRSQFRLRFTTESVGGDATGDFAHFESGNNSEGTGNIAQLVIVFRRT